MPQLLPHIFNPLEFQRPSLSFVLTQLDSGGSIWRGQCSDSLLKLMEESGFTVAITVALESKRRGKKRTKPIRWAGTFSSASPVTYAVLKYPI